MPRKKDSLKHTLFKKAIIDVTNNRTRTSYKRSITRFAQWAKENDIKTSADITDEILQKYHDNLKNDPKQYTPATIHTYLAPVCKAAGINMNKLRKNKRTSDKIIRGRKTEKNRQGKRQEQDLRFSRVVNFQKIVGIRRKELANLTGKDLIRDKDGNYVIIVQRGKGGKRQEQLVLPDDLQSVFDTFYKVGPDEKVFSDQEMNNLINFHGMRAQHARRCYYYYLDKLKTERDYGSKLRRQLVTRWENGHQKLLNEAPKKFWKQRNDFIRELRSDPYLLRGSNYQKAISADLPTNYNRLALMAVSVFQLSHWRLSVTVTNYLL